MNDDDIIKGDGTVNDEDQLETNAALAGDVLTEDELLDEELLDPAADAGEEEEEELM
jgi:hypothetical protein